MIKTYVLDTNVLIRAPDALRCFEDNQVVLPLAVLEELDNLKKLYQMDQTYADYEKVAANVIGKDAGNWFSVFLIDRGSNDGISVGMNVLADGGLAGIVTQVGPNYAKVRSIIVTTAMSVQRIFPLPICVL